MTSHGERGASAPRGTKSRWQDCVHSTSDPVPRGAHAPRSPLILALLLLLPGVAFSQEPLEKKFQVTVPYDGPEIFARLLDHAGLKPIPSLAELETEIPADKTILVVFGNPKPLFEMEKQAGGIGGFLRRGGAVLLATEREIRLSDIPSLAWPRVRVEFGDFINNSQNFQGRPQCPTIEPLDFVQPAHPVLKDLTKSVATNCPGAIVVNPTVLQTLANLPRGTVPERVGRRVDIFAIGEAALLRYPYLAVSKRPEERILLVAGHGVFMNCMTVRDDIDNRRLALNAIQWLKDDSRTHVLLLHESEPVTTFKMPLAGPPRPPIPSIEAVNRIIDAIQNEGILQKLIDQTIGPERIVRGAILLATFGLLLYGMKKFFQSRRTLEAAPAVVGTPASEGRPLVKQQMRELAARGRFGDPAQALARDWFRTYAKLDFTPGQPLPDLSFEIDAPRAQRKKLAKHIESLWQLASDPIARDWDAKRLRGLAVFLEELTMSVVAGEVVFDEPVAHHSRS